MAVEEATPPKNASTTFTETCDGPNARIVICPIGKDESDERQRSDRVFAEIIAPASRECGYEPYRAHKMTEPGMITPQILELMRDQDIVIADLSGANPNVFYELALRHLLGKRVVHISDTKVPFYMKDLRVIKFDLLDAASVQGCKTMLVAQIKAFQNQQCKVKSPTTGVVDAVDERKFLSLIDMITGEPLARLPRLRDIQACFFSRVPHESFHYAAVDLLSQDAERNFANWMDRVSTPNSTHGQVLEGRGRPPSQMWVAYGPKLSLYRPGRYIAVFRLRCCPPARKDNKPQLLQCEATSIPHVDGAEPSPLTGHRPRHCFEMSPPSDRFEYVFLDFDYRNEPGLELKLEPLNSVQAAIQLDTVSVLRIGDLQ